MTINRLTFTESNSSQQYATHNYFRYFGKLPPIVMKYVLEFGSVPNEPFVDLMCGSGTSLIEANFMGIEAIGVDVNPLSVLISRVKTTPLSISNISKWKLSLLNNIQQDVDCLPDTLDSLSLPPQIQYALNERPTFQNKDYWFSIANELTLVIIKHHIDKIDEPAYQDFFLVAFFSIIRRASNASPRTGRIFRVTDPKPVDVIGLFKKKIQEMIDGMTKFQQLNTEKSISVLQSDARHTKLNSAQYGFVLNHPPYFALYKYSSDVLRFELEWGGFNRKSILQDEIRDGFKTTKPQMLDAYVDDMSEIFQEAHRLLIPNRLFCLVVNDSTLKNVQLPVVQRLVEKAQDIGFSKAEHYIRDVMFSQARYHQSANTSIQTTEDHIIFFRK